MTNPEAIDPRSFNAGVEAAARLCERWIRSKQLHEHLAAQAIQKEILSLRCPEPQTAPTCICPRCSATIVGEMNGPEDELQTAPADWVVRKGGYFYRHGSRGYTSSLIEAGRYAESEARAQTENCEGVTAHLASEFLPPADAIGWALADEMERWREDMVPRPADEYHEDMGSALWWKFPIEEPPYVGGPNDLGQTVEVTVQAFGVDKMMRVNVGGWPGYHTHFTPIPLPSAPKNTDKVEG